MKRTLRNLWGLRATRPQYATPSGGSPLAIGETALSGKLLKEGALLRFDGWAPYDDDEIRLTFLCPNPGPDMPSYYDVVVKTADVLAAKDMNGLLTLMRDAAVKAYKPDDVKAKLDPVVGQSVVL